MILSLSIVYVTFLSSVMDRPVHSLSWCLYTLLFALMLVPSNADRYILLQNAPLGVVLIPPFGQLVVATEVSLCSALMIGTATQALDDQLYS